MNFEIKCLEWNDIKKYLDLIIDMQLENIYVFHYPNKKPNREYIKIKVLELEEHLQKGNTYFIGAIKDDNLYGYAWCYVTMFIDEKRMNINSLFVSEEVRGTGLGKQLLNKVKEIAINNKCSKIATHYAVINESAGLFYTKNGFIPARVEMLYDLRND